jgi:hypothetical protein
MPLPLDSRGRSEALLTCCRKVDAFVKILTLEGKETYGLGVSPTAVSEPKGDLLRKIPVKRLILAE